MTRLVMLVCFVISACAGSTAESRLVRHPNGHHTVLIECVERFDCIERAGEHCPTGYAILDAGAEHRKNAVSQAFENYSAAQQKRSPTDYSEDVILMHVECRR